MVCRLSRWCLAQFGNLRCSFPALTSILFATRQRQFLQTVITLLPDLVGVPALAQGREVIMGEEARAQAIIWIQVGLSLATYGNTGVCASTLHSARCWLAARAHSLHTSTRRRDSPSSAL